MLKQKTCAQRNDKKETFDVYETASDFGMNSGISYFLQGSVSDRSRVSGNIVKIDGSCPGNVNVTMAFDGGAVTGVALRDDKPFAGGYDSAGATGCGSSSAEQILFKQEQSNSDGSFGIGAIAPGKYLLMAIEKGWDVEWTNPAGPPTLSLPHSEQGIELSPFARLTHRRITDGFSRTKE
jgi:hypothetical protein